MIAQCEVREPSAAFEISLGFEEHGVAKRKRHRTEEDTKEDILHIINQVPIATIDVYFCPYGAVAYYV